MLDDIRKAMEALDALLKRTEPILGIPGKKQYVDPTSDDLEAIRLARTALWQIGDLPSEQRAMSLRELTSLQSECLQKAEYYKISGNHTLGEKFELASKYATNASIFIQTALEYEEHENGQNRFNEWLTRRDGKN